MKANIGISLLLLALEVTSVSPAADIPTPTEVDFTIRGFRSHAGQTLAESAHPHA